MNDATLHGQPAELPADEQDESGRTRVKKAAGAFRTISEVADELHIPQHVLRFWETKFPQVKPLKRGGGRRYYRPDDIALLRRISDLLYIQGYTIKGVQRLLREGGGRLSDDIPPPTEAERAQEAESPMRDHEEPQLPMPGLMPPGLPQGGLLQPALPTMQSALASEARARTQRVREGDSSTELRATLTTILHELEEMRALLP